MSIYTYIYVRKYKTQVYQYNINICKLRAPQMFISPNKWKSDGAKSGLYGGCFRARSVSTVRNVWGRALSWSNNTLFERSPRHFARIASFNSFTSMSLYRAPVTVSPFCRKCTNIVPLKDGQHDFPSGSLCLVLFVGRRQWVFPLLWLSLILWFMMVHSGLISCHNSMEKSISLVSMTVQMLLINCLSCTLVIIRQLPWDPSATHFPIPKVIMDNIVHGAVTHFEFYDDFIN